MRPGSVSPAGLIAEGHSEVIEYDLYPEVVNKQDTTAVINDCYGVEVVTIDTETGDQVGKTLHYVRNTDFFLELRSAQWVIVNDEHLQSERFPGE